MIAHINPVILKWAREERMRLTLEYAARKLRVKTEHLEEWEEGKAKPTWGMLKRIASFYKLHVTYFYLPEPPKPFPSLHDTCDGLPYHRIHPPD